TVYVHKTADLGALRSLTQCGAPLVRMVHDHDLYCMRSYKYRYVSRRPWLRAASPWCVVPCGAVLARNHGEGFPFRWVSYSDKQEELRLNRLFDRYVVATRF